MLSYEECQKMIGEKPVLVHKILKYRAYKDGNCEIFDKRDDAEKYSKLVETFCCNETENKESLVKIREYNTASYNLWYSKLKEEFNLTEKEFDVAYYYAYNDSNSDGYDAIYQQMQTYVEFIYKLKS